MASKLPSLFLAFVIYCLAKLSHTLQEDQYQVIVAEGSQLRIEHQKNIVEALHRRGLFNDIKSTIQYVENNERKIIDAIAKFSESTDATFLILFDDDSTVVPTHVFHSSFCWAKGSVLYENKYTEFGKSQYVKCGVQKNMTMPFSFENEEIKHSPVQNDDPHKTSNSFFTASAEEIAEEKKTHTSRRTGQPKKTSKHNKRGGSGGSSNDRRKNAKGEDVIEVSDRLKCKYRKTCYDENYGTKLANINNGQKRKESQINEESEEIDNLKTEKTKVKKSKSHPVESSENAFDDIAKESDKTQLRLNCKYRHSCYTEKGVDELLTKETGKKTNAAILTSTKQKTLTKNYEKPASVKDMAGDLLKKIEKREKSNLDKPKLSNVEQILANTKETRELKNECKYRKSCYENGILPEFKNSGWLSFLSTQSGEIDDSTRQIIKDESFEELSVPNQKLLCKYRQSCYESGMQPKTIKRTLGEVMSSEDDINNRKFLSKVHCKYRKSCYESGKTEIKKFEPVVPKDKHGNQILPTTTTDLKLFCKYRKSCYMQMTKDAKNENEVDDDDDDNEEEEHVENEYNENEEANVEEKESEEQNDKEKEPNDEEEEQNDKEEEQNDEEQEQVIIIPKNTHKKRRKTTTTTRQITEQENVQPTEPKKTKKEVREEFCQKISNNELFSHSLAKSEPISIKIKGKQPNQKDFSPDDEIVVISSRRHLRKVKGKTTVIDDDAVEEINEEKETDLEVEALDENLNTDSDDEEEEKESIETKEEDEDQDIELPVIKTTTIEEEHNEDENDEGSENDEKMEDSEDKSEEKDDENEEKEDGNENEENEDDDDFEDQRYKYVKLDEKLSCKYRKSCYAIDKLDEMPKEKVMVKTDPFIAQQQRRLNAMNWNRLRKEQMLRCKYRKSCYGDSHELDQEKLQLRSTRTGENVVRPNPSSNNKDEESQEQENDFGEEYETTQANQSAKVIVAMLDEDRNQVMYVLPSGEKCCKYRHSCREQVGLAPRERAPVGTNGKKLCRKKKTE